MFGVAGCFGIVSLLIQERKRTRPTGRTSVCSVHGREESAALLLNGIEEPHCRMQLARKAAHDPRVDYGCYGQKVFFVSAVCGNS